MSTTFINLEDITHTHAPLPHPLIRQFKEDSIKTDGAMQHTKLIIGAFSCQGT